ncbi:twin-arginine translocation signal domain-containing protein [Chloroflexota bacterium]
MQSNGVNNLQKTNAKESLNRRDFLKIAGIAAGTAVSAYVFASFELKNPSAQLKRNGELVNFKGTTSGKIFESLDNGETWSVSADFGKDCAVRTVRSNSAGLLAEIEYEGFHFKLQSSDGRTWFGC